MITLLLLSLLAGVLTVLAPCTLPILPLVISGSVQQKNSRRQTFIRAMLIIGSLAMSIFVFTLLLKATTVLLGVPQLFWKILSGGIVLGLGINFLFPSVWQAISIRLNLQIVANKDLGKATGYKGAIGAILTGAALGPVFSSCSPTYALIVAAILPSSFFEGILYLITYIVGMMIVLLAVAYFGSRIIHRLGWALDEHGIFRKIIGVVFVCIGLAIISGGDKIFESWLLDIGAYDGTSGLEKYFAPR